MLPSCSGKHHNRRERYGGTHIKKYRNSWMTSLLSWTQMKTAWSLAKKRQSRFVVRSVASTATVTTALRRKKSARWRNVKFCSAGDSPSCRKGLSSVGSFCRKGLCSLLQPSTNSTLIGAAHIAVERTSELVVRLAQMEKSSSARRTYRNPSCTHHRCHLRQNVNHPPYDEMIFLPRSDPKRLAVGIFQGAWQRCIFRLSAETFKCMAPAHFI